jgi:hypothetical protein
MAIHKKPEGRGGRQVENTDKEHISEQEIKEEQRGLLPCLLLALKKVHRSRCVLHATAPKYYYEYAQGFAVKIGTGELDAMNPNMCAGNIKQLLLSS